MTFADDMLRENEEVVLDCRPHWTYMLGSLALITACFLGFIAITVLVPMFWWAGVIILIASLFVGFVQFLQWQTTQFVVTNDRIITRVGVIGKAGTEIPLDRVMNISYKQSIKERILNVGDLMIESAGENGQQYFSDVANPARIQNIIYHEIEIDAEEDRTGNSLTSHHSDGHRRGGSGFGGRPGRQTGNRRGRESREDRDGGGGRDGRDGRGGREQGRDGRPQDGGPRNGGPNGSRSGFAEQGIPAQIEELDQLRRRGILTDEEFAAKKRQLLDRL